MGRERYGRIVIDRSDESSKLEKSSRIKSVKEVERSCKALASTFTLERFQPYGRNSSSIFRVRVTRFTLTQPYEAFFSRGGVR